MACDPPGDSRHSPKQAAKELRQPWTAKADPARRLPGTEATAPATGETRRRSPIVRKITQAFNPDTAAFPSLMADTNRIHRLRQLRALGIEPDLSEPSNRNRLFSVHAGDLLPPMLLLGRATIVRLNFDNDILDYTDRFYTNGIRIELIAPGLRVNPLARLLLPYRGSGTNHYGLALVQNMYTPSTTKLGGILYGDRPYAAYLFAGTFKITNDPIRKYRQTSEIDLGIIGPDSYGEWVQRSFHNAVPTNNEPLGWEYQIRDDVVLNYHILLEKGILARRHLDAMVAGTASLGTLYTNTSAGIHMRTGWFNPAFLNTGKAKKDPGSPAPRKFQAWLFMKAHVKGVGYDATLQGGVFNRSSTYTFPAREVSRLVFQGSGGITLAYNGVRCDVEQFMLSPEFDHGWWHKWVHISFSFGL